ncbi:MAG: methyltransferase domain-containing protein [Bacteroidales bacterium]|nr:methyltransferase domain-containing protein [Bacteroidales bacterium]
MFHFKHFSLYHENSSIKIGTDSVLLAAVPTLPNAHSVLDIGCGCGVIAFVTAFRLKKLFPDSQHNIIGIDIDERSIEDARRNLVFFPKSENQHIDFINISLQEYSKAGKKFDLIVCNPPFFSNSLKPASERKRQGKHSDNNLSFKELADTVTELLTPNGHFHLILPTNESDIFKELADNKLHKFQETDIIPVKGEKPNRRIMMFGRDGAMPTSHNTLTIRASNSLYTEEYRDITADFLFVK